MSLQVVKFLDLPLFQEIHMFGLIISAHHFYALPLSLDVVKETTLLCSILLAICGDLSLPGNGVTGDPQILKLFLHICKMCFLAILLIVFHTL